MKHFPVYYWKICFVRGLVIERITIIVLLYLSIEAVVCSWEVEMIARDDRALGGEAGK